MMTEYVKNRRSELGMSCKGLAERLLIDASLISKWESGSRSPTLRHLISLSEVLDVPIDELKKHWYADKIVELLHEDPNLAD